MPGILCELRYSPTKKIKDTWAHVWTLVIVLNSECVRISNRKHSPLTNIPRRVLHRRHSRNRYLRRSKKRILGTDLNDRVLRKKRIHCEPCQDHKIHLYINSKPNTTKIHLTLIGIQSSVSTSSRHCRLRYRRLRASHLNPTMTDYKSRIETQSWDYFSHAEEFARVISQIDSFYFLLHSFSAPSTLYFLQWRHFLKTFFYLFFFYPGNQTTQMEKKRCGFQEIGPGSEAAEGGAQNLHNKEIENLLHQAFVIQVINYIRK